MDAPLEVTPAVVIPAGDLRWRAVRASGPGGQNVNKVSSKVELVFDVRACRALDAGTKARLCAAHPSWLDADGALVVRSQLTRDQPRNLEDARQKLREAVVAALYVPKRRKPTKPSRGAKERRLGEKKLHGQKKRDRRVRDD